MIPSKHRWLSSNSDKGSLEGNRISMQQHHSQNEQPDLGKGTHFLIPEAQEERMIPIQSRSTTPYAVKYIQLERSKTKISLEIAKNEAGCRGSPESTVWEKAMRWLYFVWNLNQVATYFHTGGLPCNLNRLMLTVILQKEKKIKSWLIAWRV